MEPRSSRMFFLHFVLKRLKIAHIMKGVILAGGSGSRLFPSTKVVNKHLLPVFDRPMIYYPIQTLKQSGISEILIISSPEHSGDFMRLLGSGVDFDVRFTYKIQDGAGGIAQALSLAEGFAAGDSIAVILSDNIFEDDFSEEVFYFQKGAQIFVKKVEDPSRFGVVEVRKDGTVRSVEEKPAFTKSNLAQTGFFLYDSGVFELIRHVQPSKRGELEITDVNKLYLEDGALRAVEVDGMWVDAGTHESLLEASLLAQESFDPARVSLRRVQKSLSVASEQEEGVRSPKVTVGILTYNSEKYLEPCLRSLLGQDYENLEIVVLDNASVDNTVGCIKSGFPGVRLIEGEENVGFGCGHNIILRESEGDFYACLNIDMIFEPNFISELVRAISEKPVYGSAGGKLKRWDFEAYCQDGGAVQDKGKTNFIDSMGIKIFRSHRFEDVGQAEVDYGQYDNERDIFGVSGAAVLYRRKALEDTAFVNEDGVREYFDELMFMYKDDVDLAYRLQWGGWKCRFTPASVAFHDRTISAPGRGMVEMVQNRLKKIAKVNQGSYLNHHILLGKNFVSEFSLGVRGATFWYNSKVFVYLLFFETETLGQWWKLFWLRSKVRQRREGMVRRVSQAEIEGLMEAS